LSAFAAGASAIGYEPFRLQELAVEIHKTLNSARLPKDCRFPPLPEEPNEHLMRYTYSLDDSR